MTPDPTNPQAPATAEPTPPAAPQPTAPHEPTPPVPPAAAPPPPAGTAAPAFVSHAAATVAHTGAEAKPDPEAKPAPEVAPPGETKLAAAVAAPGAAVPPAAPPPADDGVAPAPGQIAAAAEIVNRDDDEAKEQGGGLGTAAKVGLAAAATAAVGAAAAAVAAAVRGDDDDRHDEKDEEQKQQKQQPSGGSPAPPKPVATTAAPLAQRMGKSDPGPVTAASPNPNVPHVPDEGELGGEDLVKADAGGAQPAKPAPPPASRGIAIPKSAELDPELEAQLSAGLGDDALSLQMNAAAAQAGAGGPAVDGDQSATGADAPAPGHEEQASTPSPMVGSEESLEAGQKLMGKVDSKTDSDVFVNLGLRYQGIIPRTDYPDGKGPPVGFSGAFLVDRVDTENGLIHLHSPRGARKVSGSADWESLSVGQNVECSVTGTNKGGLQVQVGKLRGFMPASQIDLGYVADLNDYKGKKLNARIIEVKPEKRNLVLSRAAILKEERKGKEQEVWQSLTAGETRPGIVRALKPYGAFVDIGGVDGFLHIGEISHNRIGHPQDVLTVGDKIEVKVLKVDPDSKKVGLGMKQLTKNPWQVIEESYPVGSTCKGKVTKCTEFGAFVEIEKGVEGLIHISELDHKRVSRVSDVVRVNEEVEAKVLQVEPNRKRIALSLKALKEKPAGSAPGKKSRKRKDEEPDLPAYERQRKGPLKGGVGDGKGGLFGDPTNFGDK